MDIKRGREIFFECFGNHMIITKEYGDEYEKCHISKECEYEWNKEVRLLLKSKINESIGCDMLFYVDRYIELLKGNEAIHYLLTFLKEKEIDSFSSLLLLETCKNLVLSTFNSNEKKEYLREIKSLKDKYLSKPINIDPSYLSNKYCSMITIDAIKNRYKKL